jgi:hypothetical protein
MTIRNPTKKSPRKTFVHKLPVENNSLISKKAACYQLEFNRFKYMANKQ